MVISEVVKPLLCGPHDRHPLTCGYRPRQPAADAPLNLACDPQRGLDFYDTILSPNISGDVSPSTWKIFSHSAPPCDCTFYHSGAGGIDATYVITLPRFMSHCSAKNGVSNDSSTSQRPRHCLTDSSSLPPPHHEAGIYSRRTTPIKLPGRSGWPARASLAPHLRMKNQE